MSWNQGQDRGNRGNQGGIGIGTRPARPNLPPQVQQPPVQVQPQIEPIRDVATIPADVTQWTADMLRVLGWNSKRAAQRDMNAKNQALLQTHANTISPLIGDLQQKHAALDAAFAANGVWSSAQEMQAAEIRATLAFEAMPNRKPELKGGSANATFWLKGVPDPITHEDKEFIFKPALPVSLMAGVPIGGEPIREALAGRAAELLTAYTGLDFKMPLTNVIAVDSARLADYRPVDTTMALRNTPTQIGSLQQFSPSQGELRKNLLARRQQITAQSCQNVAILDTVVLNLDRHDGNLLLDQAGTGVIPIDHGLSLPDANAVRTGNLGRNMAGDKNVVLRLPKSYEPFSQASLDGIADIEPDLMQAALSAESAKMGQVQPSLLGTMSNEALTISKLATRFLKAAAPHLPPAVLQAALGANAAVLLDIAASPTDLAQATAQVIADYTPKVAAIKAFWMMPGDAREALYERLDSDGLVSNMSDDREKWLYDNIDLVLQYRSGTKAKPKPRPRAPEKPAIDDARAQIGKFLPDLKLPKADADWLPEWHRILDTGSSGDLARGLQTLAKPKFKTLREVRTWFATYMQEVGEREKQIRLQAICSAFPQIGTPTTMKDPGDQLEAWIGLGRLGGMNAVRATIATMNPAPAPRDPREALLVMLAADPPDAWAQALAKVDYLDEIVALDAALVSPENQQRIVRLRAALTDRTLQARPDSVADTLVNNVVTAAVPLIGARYDALEFRLSEKAWEVAENFIKLAYSGQVKSPVEYLLSIEQSASPVAIRT